MKTKRTRARRKQPKTTTKRAAVKVVSDLDLKRIIGGVAGALQFDPPVGASGGGEGGWGGGGGGGEW